MAQSDPPQRCKAMSDLGGTGDIERRYELDGSVAFGPNRTLGKRYFVKRSNFRRASVIVRAT
jgi:hypothetical protein